MAMKFFWVKRRTLLILAGVIWVVAGANILRIGLMDWGESSQNPIVMVGEAIAIGSLFFWFVFKRLFTKNTRRMKDKREYENCPFSFFDTKGWVMMGFMITLGVLARSYGWLPVGFIAVFYVGLSSALIITGVMFIRYFFKYKNF